MTQEQKYSQNNEEAYILEAVAGIEKGRLLDIGAYDGRTFSNSAALIDRGWSAVLVEPSPVPLAALVERYARSPEVRVVGAMVIPDAKSPFTLMHVTGDAVSTTDAALRDVWASSVAFAPAYFPSVCPRTLVAVFEPAEGFDFITIDVEDNNAAVLREVLGCAKLPKCICIEHTAGGRDQREEIIEIIDSTGALYDITYTSAENYVLVRV